MSDKYRVVLTCWDPDTPKPYADDFSGVELSLFPTQDLAQEGIEEAIKDELECLNCLDSDQPREKVPVHDSDGNIVAYDYPFRGDLYGDHDGIVRLWDGDDYREVTAYNIHRLSCDADDLNECSYYIYRGFWILPNEAHTSFKIEQFDTTLFRFKTLKRCLREIDDIMVDLSYGARAHKTALDAQIHAAARTAQSLSPVKDLSANTLDREATPNQTQGR